MPLFAIFISWLTLLLITPLRRRQLSLRLRHISAAPGHSPVADSLSRCFYRFAAPVALRFIFVLLPSSAMSALIDYFRRLIFLATPPPHYFRLRFDIDYSHIADIFITLMIIFAIDILFR
jgi:hypothetical protein